MIIHNNNDYPKKFVKEFKVKALNALKNKEKWQCKYNHLFVYNDSTMWYSIRHPKINQKGHKEWGWLIVSLAEPDEHMPILLQWKIYNLSITAYRAKKMIQTVNMRDFYANIIRGDSDKQEEITITSAPSGSLIKGVAMASVNAGDVVEIQAYGAVRVGAVADWSPIKSTYISEFSSRNDGYTSGLTSQRDGKTMPYQSKLSDEINSRYRDLFKN